MQGRIHDRLTTQICFTISSMTLPNLYTPHYQNRSIKRDAKFVYLRYKCNDDAFLFS